jgi:hypothetical protein
MEKFFPNQNYNISKTNRDGTFLVTDKNNSECIIFTDEPDELYIDKLHTCNNSSGAQNLEKAVLLAEHAGKPKVCLHDESTINFKCGQEDVSVDLAGLKLLSTGKSWYNKMGFESYKFSDEIKHNDNIISKKFGNVITGSTEFNEIIIKITGKTEEEIGDMTVKEVFQEISEYLKNKTTECNADEIKIINKLILTFRGKHFSNGLKYGKGLCKNLRLSIKTQGGKSNRRLHRHKKKTRRKNNRRSFREK